MSLREKAVKGVAWSAVQNWGSSLITAAVLLVLVRFLDRTDFGLFSIAAAFIALVDVMLRAGLSQALIQRADVQPGHLDTAFWSSVVLGVSLCALTMLSAGSIQHLFDQPGLASVIQWCALTFLIGSVGNTQQSILQRQFAFRALSVRTLVATVAGGIVGITMAYSGFGVWSLVGQTLTSRLVGAVVLWTASAWRPGIRVSFAHFRDLYSFGFYVMTVELMGFVSQYTDRLLIGYALGAGALGTYHVAMRVIQVTTQLFTQSVAAVALPTFSRLQRDVSQMRSAYLTATQLAGVFTVPALLGIAVLAPELVAGLFGTRWEASVPLLRIFSFLGIIQGVFYFNGPVMLAAGKPAWVLALRCMHAVTQVVAIVVALPWGLIGVATAVTVRPYLLSMVPLLALRSLLSLSVPAYLRRFVPALTASLAAVAVLLGARAAMLPSTSVRIHLAIGILIGAAAYLAALILVAPALARQVLQLLHEGFSRASGRQTVTQRPGQPDVDGR